MNYEQLVAGVTGLVRWCAVWQPQAVAGAFLLSLMPGSRLACGCHCTLFAAFLLLHVPDSEEHPCTWSATCVTQHMGSLLFFKLGSQVPDSEIEAVQELPRLDDLHAGEGADLKVGSSSRCCKLDSITQQHCAVAVHRAR